MSALSMRAKNVGVAGVAVLSSALATAAYAGPNPLTINLSVDGVGVAPIVNAGVPNAFVGDNRMEYIGSFGTSDYLVEWQIFGDVNPGMAFGSFEGVGLSGSLIVTNLSGASHNFELSAEVLLAAAMANSSYSGSMSLSMLSSTEGGAGTAMSFGTLTGQSMYAASINGSAVQQFVNDPTTYNVPAGGSDADGPFDYGPGIGPALITSLGHSFAFSLSGSAPGLSAGDYDKVTFSFALTVVPAPAGLALLGVAGLVGRRRRRE